MSGAAATTLWARSFVDELARAGVREVVVAPGSRSTPLVLACALDGRLRMRVHLDERSAAFFALGVGKATGRPAAVITTSGTAVANVFPAVIEASQAGVPLLVLTADRPPHLRDSDANQAVDQVGIFGRYPRAFFEPGVPELRADSIRYVRGVAARAVAASVAPDAGPVHVNFPFDKPLEPEGPPPAFVSAHPAVVAGRPDGAPWVRVQVERPKVSDPDIAEVADLLRGRRGVVVAGPSEDARRLGPAVLRLAAQLAWPVLADPLSGARYGPSRGVHVAAAYDLFLRDRTVRAHLAPEVVVRVGVSPTSAALQSWLNEHEGIDHVVVDDGGRWKDHGAVSTRYLVADPVDALERLTAAVRPHLPAGTSNGRPTSEGDSGAWAELWRTVERAALDAMTQPAADALHEGHVMATVLSEVPAEGTLFVSSSMPIRDLDAYGHPRDTVAHVLANRGASGIDGVVSTAFGVSSQESEPVVCVIGDVAFFHDRNGLLFAREADCPVVFVLVDNDGGGIFHMLPVSDHDPHFTTFFATPHGVDAQHAARAHDVDFREAGIDDVAPAVRAGLASRRTVVIRVRTEREDNRRRHQEVREAVERSVRAVLG
jgi:2-succinyl-5-enolpyruvyl-6-hydroxy-3-cyclohexene-1-carboxylate synthase